MVAEKFMHIKTPASGNPPDCIVINVSDNIVFIDAVTEDGYKKYGGKAILRVKVKKEPEFTHYLNGVLRIRLSRV